MSQSSGAHLAPGLAPLQDHWTPTIVQLGAVFVTIFQIVYLLHDHDTAPPEALYLHLTNIVIAFFGFISSLFPFGRVYGRVISFWGLAILMASMMRISSLTGDNDWFYVSLALLTMGASAMMPWEIGWQTGIMAVCAIPSDSATSNQCKTGDGSGTVCH